MTRISNRQCRHYVNDKEPFDANHIFARNVDRFYIVYSWGLHFPMYIYDREYGIWFGNRDKYSKSTSKHQSQAMPSDDIQWLNTNELLKIITTRSAPYWLRRNAWNLNEESKIMFPRKEFP